MIQRLREQFDEEGPNLARIVLYNLLWITPLYIISLYNYLLFHVFTEFFSITVAAAVFMIAWNARRYLKNPYLVFIGTAYLFIGFIDLMHTLSYKGMNIFTDYDFYANQLWIGARYMESLSLLIAFFFLKRNRIPNMLQTGAVYLIITLVLIFSVFDWKIFPICFIEGSGLTPFKILSEYLISAVFVASIFLLYRNRASFDSRVFKLLLYSIIFTIISELAFTFYISNYGFSNLIGHFFKVFSYILIYQALIQTGFQEPFILIFRELDGKNHALNEEIKQRIAAEQEKEQLISELTQALDEIKTLKGIIPVCMHCKKVRDDSGYWAQLEEYISAHSEAEFSHGLCPDCLEKYYPEVSQLKQSNESSKNNNS